MTSDSGVFDVEAYLARFPEDRRATLQQVREAILGAVPGGEEKVRYGMPAVMLGGRYALHYAGWKKHIGLYPVPMFEGELEREVAPHRAAKDAVNLPWSDVPVNLIAGIAAAIVALRASQSEELS